MDAKPCCRCKQLKPHDDFPRNKNTSDGVDYKCKQCHRELWHGRKPAAKREIFRIQDFTPTQENVRRIFDLGDDGLLRWKFNMSDRTLAGSIAGDRSNGRYQRIIIGGKRFRGDDLITLYRVGEFPDRSLCLTWSKADQVEYMRELRREMNAFPDWSCLWAKEKARRASVDRWAKMSVDERRAKAAGRDVDKKRQSRRDWAKRNVAKSREINMRWIINNPDKARESRRKERAKPHNKAKSNLRSRFKDLVRSARLGGGDSFSRFIGCTTRQLSDHISKQFKKGMTWQNYGTHWHIDHILPVASFNHRIPSHVRQCWHFTNLRPLEASENLLKSDRITQPQMSLCL